MCKYTSKRSHQRRRFLRIDPSIGNVFTRAEENEALQMFFQHILISLKKNKGGRAAAWRPRASGRRNLVTGTPNNAN